MACEVVQALDVLWGFFLHTNDITTATWNRVVARRWFVLMGDWEK
ncbi:hypothetical protein EGR_09636 [Echinococcus granulosus]|uniref:Uncharacterized protein n=1 Tax=Echinococcus granulosus TaxID=6210 RepID=W6U310_ECHGR|nr:hypothetical protein EGR_09636 [Echinococcus granulosus]EUB55495.1 hypothetical protein EGR_09636 [Echinococcus granulosus]